MHKNKILISFLLVFGLTVPALAQRQMTYPMLVKHSRQPRVYYDYLVIPKNNSNQNTVFVTFKIENDYLTFKKDVADNGDQYTRDNHSFQARININLEVFKGDSTIIKRMENRPEQVLAQKGRDRRDERKRREEENNFKIAGKESIARSYWRGTAKANTYEETQSHKEYTQGVIKVNLKPGYYRTILQLSQPDNGGDTHSSMLMIHVPNYTKSDASSIIMLNHVTKFGISSKLPVLNFGHNVYYGKDFGILFRVPQNITPNEYKVFIHNLGTNPKDTSSSKIAYSSTIGANDIAKGVVLNPDTSSDQIYLKVNKGNSPFSYAYATIPNHKFGNDTYRIVVRNTKTNKILTSRYFQSRWLNMPTSLLNLDVAIKMLRFIVKKQELKKIDSGSNQEREKKFKAFWKKRDPTPNTQYNELMAEYYRRIDYAWEHFTTLNKPGYDTDIGKVYIKMGPPDSIERRYPANEPAIIIWKYGKRKFIFQATSGFGDYELVK